MNTGEFLRHGHYLATSSTTPPTEDCAEGSLRCIDGSLVPAQCPDPDDEIVIDESSEGDTSSDATDSIDGNQTEDTSEEDAGSETDGVPTTDETDQPGSSENSDDTDSGGADAIATTENGQNTLSQEFWLSGKQPERLAFDPSRLSLPFSS